MKYFFLIGILFTSKVFFAQLPETDIFLCTIGNDNGKYIFSKPVNITDRPGYDNQPCFTPDNKRLLYVSVADSNQSDIYSYDLAEKISVQVTDTKESEFSPAYIPGRNFLSVVRVDADSGQRFYCLPLANTRTAIEVKNTDSIGYACWLNDSSLAMFILGPSNTLQVLNIKNHKRRLIAADIGRCMRMSADRSKMFFVLKSNPNEWFIYSLDATNMTMTRIAKTPEGSEDFAVMNDGSLIIGKEGKLFLLGHEAEWSMIADFTDTMKDFYRLAISNDGKMLALVAFTGKKP